MDLTNKLEASKYVLPLDALDLALLPTFYSSRVNNNTTSLRTSNKLNLNSNEYFEFKIQSKTDETINNSDETNITKDPVTTQNSQKYEPKQSIPTEAATKCHICNVQISTAYITAHENSLKHRAYLRIAEVALDRTRKQLLKENRGSVHKQDSTYFCDPCASEIQLVNKYSHEKSKEHKKSVSLDRHLFELVALYKDEQHEYTEEESSEQKKLIDNNKDGRKTEHNENIANDTVLINNFRALLNDFEIKTMEHYIKFIDQCDKDKPYTLSSDGNDLKVSMGNNCEVMVAMDNFNGFVRLEDNVILCILCKMLVNNPYEHKFSDIHIKNIIIPFNNHHCIRHLDSILSNCVICNKIINNLDLHVVCDETHIELHQKALVDKEKEPSKQLETTVDNNNKTDSTVQKELDNDIQIHTQSNKPDENQLVDGNKLKEIESKSNIEISTPNAVTVDIGNNIYHCLTCNLTMPVKNKETHVNEKNHKMNSKSKLHYLMRQEEISGNLVCRLCKVYVADDVKQLKEHVATDEHKYKYNYLLTINNIIRLNKNFYCYPCEIVLLKMNELCHTEKPTHKYNLTYFREEMGVIHTGTRNNSINVTNSNDSKLYVKIPGYYCKICNIYIPNNPYNISSHNDGVEHKTFLLQTVAGEAADSIENNTSVTDCDVHYQMDVIENEKNLMCKVCNIVVPNIKNNITEHITEKKHESLLQTILDANHIESVDEQYFCKACKLHIKTQSLFEHINETEHKTLANLKQEQEINKTIETQTLEVKIDTIKDKNDNTQDIAVKTSQPLDKLYKKFKHHFIETQNKKWFKCKVCPDVEIPKSIKKLGTHAALQMHVDGYKKLMLDCCILETDSRTYFCAVCACLVPIKGEVHHARGIRHAGSHTKAMSVENCDICDVNVNIPGLSMLDHVTTPEHIAKIVDKYLFQHYCMFCKLLMRIGKAKEHADSCHKSAVIDNICFCSTCDPHIPDVIEK